MVNTNLESELVFEIESNEEQILEILKRIDRARKLAMVGQVLRISINHNTTLIFKNLTSEKLSVAQITESTFKQNIDLQNLAH